jgi:hypothetical protein
VNKERKVNDIMATQQVVPVTCPSCNTQFTTPIENIIDGQNPASKSAFLEGRLNVTQCPQCGLTSPLGVPIFYYDLEKELALVLVPDGLQMAGADQEKMIGDLTNRVVNSLPAEQRKFYLFNPKQFLTMETMAKAILEADGITEEVLEAQTAKVKLIEEFLSIGDEAALKKKAKEHDQELDRQFFEILTASIQAAQMEGNQAGVQTLFALRALLAEWSTQGQQAVKEIDAELGLAYIQGQEDLLEKLQGAENDEEFESLVAIGYPLLDYSFFQKLTAKIDEAAKAKDTKKAKDLTDFRSKILDVKARHEEKSQAALQKAAELLKEILQSGDPQKTLEQKLDDIDDAFFAILSANIQEARRQKQDQAAQTMGLIGNMAIGMLQERMKGEAQAGRPIAESEIHLPR